MSLPGVCGECEAYCTKEGDHAVWCSHSTQTRLAAENEHLRSSLLAAEKERDEARQQRDTVVDLGLKHLDERDSMREVVEAATAWRSCVAGLILGSHEQPLAAAVDSHTTPKEGR